MSRTELVNLREHPELKKEVAQLLNSEWPRSESARLVSPYLRNRGSISNVSSI